MLRPYSTRANNFIAKRKIAAANRKTSAYAGMHNAGWLRNDCRVFRDAGGRSLPRKTAPFPTKKRGMVFLLLNHIVKQL
jgi:hypothetical protein